MLLLLLASEANIRSASSNGTFFRILVYCGHTPYNESLLDITICMYVRIGYEPITDMVYLLLVVYRRLKKSKKGAIYGSRTVYLASFGNCAEGVQLYCPSRTALIQQFLIALYFSSFRSLCV